MDQSTGLQGSVLWPLWVGCGAYPSSNCWVLLHVASLSHNVEALVTQDFSPLGSRPLDPRIRKAITEFIWNNAMWLMHLEGGEKWVYVLHILRAALYSFIQVKMLLLARYKLGPNPANS